MSALRYSVYAEALARGDELRRENQRLRSALASVARQRQREEELFGRELRAARSGARPPTRLARWLVAPLLLSLGGLLLGAVGAALLFAQSPRRSPAR